MGFIPPWLAAESSCRRVRPRFIRLSRADKSAYPENQIGFPRITYEAGWGKHGMTVKEISGTPQLAAGGVHRETIDNGHFGCFQVSV